jgi:hypothetical protein
MAITSLDGLLGAYKQVIPMCKTNSITTVAGQPSTLIDRAGYPSAGSLNPSQTTNGVVPTDATTGYPTIAAFQGGNLGYLSRVEIVAPVSCAIAIYDVLFMAGQTTIPTSGTTTVTLSAQPSFAARVPFKGDGVTRNYGLVELFLQSSVAWSNHGHSTAITYLDQDGNSGSTGNISTQNTIINRWVRAPLAAGDTGVSGISSYAVNGIASAAGAVSVVCARRLFLARTNGFSNIFGPDQTGMPQVFADSALLMVAYMDSTSSSIPSVTLEIAEG